jgi:hypothetical protein
VAGSCQKTSQENPSSCQKNGQRPLLLSRCNNTIIHPSECLNNCCTRCFKAVLSSVFYACALSEWSG